MFVDRVKAFAQAGKGGRGSVSFRREKFVPKGGPDGGDGGRGGDVILRADRHVDNLANLFYEPIIKAKDGGHGMGKKMSGRAGADKVVKIPVGTVVWRGEQTMPVIPSEVEASHEITSTVPWQDSSTSHGTTGAEVVADLTRDGQDFVLCRGGAGGKGNVHFKSSRNRAPRQYTEGEEGEQGHFLLELRTIADVGLKATRTRASQRCYGKFPQRGPRSRRIHLQRCTRSLASLNFQVIGAVPSRIFRV